MALVEPPRRQTPKPKLATVLKDLKGNYCFVVEEERLKSRKAVSPKVVCWWSREPRKVVGGATVREEHILLRQENEERADLLIITHGQAYDLMDALSRLVESP